MCRACNEAKFSGPLYIAYAGWWQFHRSLGVLLICNSYNGLLVPDVAMLMILLVLLGVWAISATILLFGRNPLPVPDRGHRLYAVPNERARDAALQVFKLAGVRGAVRFRTGPSDQTVLSDNTTTLHILSGDSGQSGNGVSLVVRNPARAAEEAVAILCQAGFSAQRLQTGAVSGLPSDELVVITSDAFTGWALGFRRHQLKLPRPDFLPAE